MLNAQTKRHIDNARDILVGVVPNPTSQIDQITNALIYKFMDDMDQAAIKVGADPSFFIKDLEQYAWSRLMSDRLGNQERMNLYAEALAKFATASQLPQLFRDIFKSSFLPYRSPEVLGLFLKEINYFDYAHPEELGNAYEYLLQIMGSQGDAGQFRTPRHIIDFVVDVINPTKDDKVLDPACGTAGFLISAYKHILEQHDGKDDPKKQEKPLTPEERKKLFANFEGYDIDPSMVRIAQVNMYLHQFKNPKVAQYDSLSQEERWGDKYDVILANPPFMSPRGGIRPHNKFSIQSTRSEVLFVDYIMNHLRPKGRAGIIVPEGIIFQSSGAYKQLRKMLVEDGLFAVVSLPQGVFNPYAGVKTSILFFDKVAKKTDKILFVRVLNDGFDLGAQRRPIDRNDLVRPDNEVDATKVLKGQRIAIETGTKNPWLQENSLFAYEISKEQIAQSGDYNLSAERYRLDNLGEQKNQKWQVAELGEVIDLDFGTRITKKNDEGSMYPVYGGGGESFRTDSFNREDEMVISRFAMSENCVRFVSGKFFMLDSGFTFSIKPGKKEEVLKEYVGKYLLSIQPKIYACARGHAQKNIDVKAFKKIKIPLPPIEVQKEIVEQIEVKQNAIEHAKAIIENLERERRYFGQSLRKLGDVEMIKLDDVCDLITDGTHISPKYTSTGVPMLDAVDIENFMINDSNPKKFISKETDKELTKRCKPKAGDVLVSSRGSIGKLALVGAKQDFNIMGNIILLRPSNKILPRYLLNTLHASVNSIADLSHGVAQKGLYLGKVREFKIPLPSLEVQNQMVKEIEKEEEIIASNRKLIEVMENKISAVLSEV